MRSTNPMWNLETRVDAIVTSIARLIARGGIAEVTTRKVAAETRMAHSGLSYDLGNRRRMLEVAAQIFGDRLRDAYWLTDDVHRLLPDEGADLAPTRVWLTFRDLALSETEIAAVVHHFDGIECDVIRRCLEIDRERAAALHVFILGLRVAICRTVDPLPLESAHRLLTEHLSLYVGRSAA